MNVDYCFLLASRLCRVICFELFCIYELWFILWCLQMMQGDIWVVPNSQGFAESMMLVLRFQLQPTVLPEPGGSSENPPSSLFRGLKVLVADDDDVNRSVTRRLLEKLGCNVSAVASGVECLNSLGAMGTSFQVILLDLHMPEMDGFEVARRIPKYRSGSWPLIVALTASVDEDVWERCLQSGMNGVIRKPVLLQTMRDELYRVLQASQVVWESLISGFQSCHSFS